MNNWLRYPNDPSAVTELLEDYDVSGKHVPSWVTKVAVSTMNGDVTKTEFGNMLRYLSNQNLLS